MSFLNLKVKCVCSQLTTVGRYVGRIEMKLFSIWVVLMNFLMFSIFTTIPLGKRLCTWSFVVVHLCR